MLTNFRLYFTEFRIKEDLQMLVLKSEEMIMMKNVCGSDQF